MPAYSDLSSCLQPPHPCKYPWLICLVKLMIYFLDASSLADTLTVAWTWTSERLMNQVHITLYPGNLDLHGFIQSQSDGKARFLFSKSTISTKWWMLHFGQNNKIQAEILLSQLRMTVILPGCCIWLLLAYVAYVTNQ